MGWIQTFTLFWAPFSTHWEHSKEQQDVMGLKSPSLSAAAQPKGETELPHSQMCENGAKSLL